MADVEWNFASKIRQGYSFRADVLQQIGGNVLLENLKVPRVWLQRYDRLESPSQRE